MQFVEDIISLGQINISVRYRECGIDKKSIIFIHGMFQTKDSWLKIFSSYMMKKYNIYTFDLRGHGMSEKPKSLKEYLLSKKWADDLYNLINYFGINKPIIVAWSYGGYVVNDFLSYYSDDLLGSIVYVGGALKLDKAFEYIGKGLLDNVGDILSKDEITSTNGLTRFIENCFMKKIEENEIIKLVTSNKQTPQFVRKALVARVLDYEDVLKKISIPVLFVHGKFDNIIDLQMAYYGKNLIKNSKLVEFDKSGHMLFIEENEKFCVVLREFIEAI